MTKSGSRGNNTVISPKQIETVKKVVLEEDRSRNRIIHGVEETENEDIDSIVSDVMNIYS